MSSMMTMGALESLFDAEQTAAVLLEAVKDNVDNTVKTVDAAAALENKLSEEAARFNECLTTMSNAIRKCERGEISREEMLAECAPCVSALKEKCTALTLGNVKTTGDDITEPEIAMLREYIVGCKDIVAARKQELQDCACASEGLMASLANFEPATESKNGKLDLMVNIRESNEAKTAVELYKQATKLYGLGSKEKALEYLKKAQGLYESCLKKCEDAARMYKVERTVKYATAEDKFKTSITDNRWLANLIAYFEDRVDSCRALEMQWNNKAGKSTYAETKAQLKAERKETRHANRLNKAKERAGTKAARKLARSAKGYAVAAYKEKMANASSQEEADAIESMFEIMYATEAFADALLNDYDLISAFEAEGEETPESEYMSEDERKLRDLYVQFNEAKGNNDESEMNRLTGEIQKVLDKVSKEAQDAYTEDDLKTANRKLAKGLAIGAAVVATVATVAYGVKTGTFSNIAARAKEQAEKLRKSQGENKGETAKAKGAIANLKNALGHLKGKIKLGKKEGSGSMDSLIGGMSSKDFIASMESLMNSIMLDLAMEAAMEAEGDGGAEGATTASGFGAKLKSAFAKLKRAKKSGNDREAAEANREISETTEELADAMANAETPEEKAKLSKAAKIGIAAAAAVIAVVGGIIYKKTRGPKVEVLDKNDPRLATIANALGKTAEKNMITTNDVKLISQGARTVLTLPPHTPGVSKVKIRRKGTNESFLSGLAFGLEEFIDVDDDDDYEKSFNGEGFDLDEVTTEAAIAVMLAEDGIDDSDLF